MLDWNSIICFCEVARSGNFSASAKTQNMSVATLTRKINSLEKQIGVDLFYRNTRKLVLTDEGNKLYQKVYNKVASLQEELLIYQEEKSIVQAKVKIATLPELADVYLAPAINQLTNSNPEVQVEMLLSPDLVDVDFENIDFALRAGEPGGEGVKACKVGTETLSAYRYYEYEQEPTLPLGTYDNTFIHDKRTPIVIAPSMQVLKNMAKSQPMEVYLSNKWLATTSQKSEFIVNNELEPYSYDIFLVYGSKRVLKPAARKVLDIMKNQVFG
ncbi:LysR family transcriptional regulator [Vibrio hannami]|uniref:LysR family transcriptional regulator n=1 Tax=Vibrio hannami TaxID=2717094 RepID=UPI00241031A7|nr:LysR family transcriptional regulator [Vibrio hannami]MDG3085567.1 LysR family transcriptional regulator [Vibrio hannami]